MLENNAHIKKDTDEWWGQCFNKAYDVLINHIVKGVYKPTELTDLPQCTTFDKLITPQAKQYAINEICDRDIFSSMIVDKQLARIGEVQDVIDNIQAQILYIKGYQFIQVQPISRFLVLMGHKFQNYPWVASDVIKTWKQDWRTLTPI